MLNAQYPGLLINDGMSKLTASEPMPPYFFTKNKYSGVKIRPVIKKTHEVENVKSQKRSIVDV